ncbi:hypothetical protein MJ588_09615 [Klebsiella pneumoniae]|nr:hypothetical protein MJ588_09615 [Klebsiella pneumoniae]
MPTISNQVNVQAGALANVVIIQCITPWALYLIFHNKAVITQGLIHPADHSLSFFSFRLSAPRRWSGTGWPAPYFVVRFFFSLFDPGNSLKLMMGATPQKSAHPSAARRWCLASCRAG